MRYIHQLQEWPVFQYDASKVNGLLSEVRFQQGLLVGKMEQLPKSGQVDASVVALSHGVVASSAIEGEILDVDCVKRSVASRCQDAEEDGAPASVEEGAVAVMLDATKNSQQPLSQARLFRWHDWLFSGSTTTIERGQWRSDATGRMRVVSERMDGTDRVHFEAPTPDRVASEMDGFLKWFSQSQTLDPVVLSGLAHLYFLTIHPFHDGNGRIARAISEMCLARSEPRRPRFYSVSKQIEKERAEYYVELELNQKAQEMDVTDWLVWFLGCLQRAILSAEEVIQQTLTDIDFERRLSEFGPNLRQTKVMGKFTKPEFKGTITSSKYAKMAKCSQDTAIRDINALVKAGLLVASEAGGRSRSYYLDRV